MPKSLCTPICKPISEHHNSKVKLKLDPGYQVKSECIAEKLGLPKPVPTGS
jgi:hypothetical protein